MAKKKVELPVELIITATPWGNFYGDIEDEVQTPERGSRTARYKLVEEVEIHIHPVITKKGKK